MSHAWRRTWHICFLPGSGSPPQTRMSALPTTSSVQGSSLSNPPSMTVLHDLQHCGSSQGFSFPSSESLERWSLQLGVGEPGRTPEELELSPLLLSAPLLQPQGPCPSSSNTPHSWGLSSLHMILSLRRTQDPEPHVASSSSFCTWFKCHLPDHP